MKKKKLKHIIQDNDRMLVDTMAALSAARDQRDDINRQWLKMRQKHMTLCAAIRAERNYVTGDARKVAEQAIIDSLVDTFND